MADLPPQFLILKHWMVVEPISVGSKRFSWLASWAKRGSRLFTIKERWPYLKQFIIGMHQTARIFQNWSCQNLVSVGWVLMDPSVVEDTFSWIPRKDQIQSMCHNIRMLFPHASIPLLLHQNIDIAVRIYSAYSSIDALYSVQTITGLSISSDQVGGNNQANLFLRNSIAL